MSKQVQFRRGSTLEHTVFTGVEGEVTVDTTKNVVVVHDGVTAGGHAMATEAFVTELVGGAPALLNTLQELSAAIGDDPDFITTIQGQVALKADTASLAAVATSGDFGDLTGSILVEKVADTIGGGSTVAIKSILTVDDAFGSNDSEDPASAQAIRGRVTGSNLTKTRNYITGVTGQYLVTGSNNSEFINAGVLGVVGDQTTTANAAIVAYLDGDGGLTTAGAAYAVSMKNSTPGSGFDYGLDLQWLDLNLSGMDTPFKIADIRFNNGVELVANTAGAISITGKIKAAQGAGTAGGYSFSGTEGGADTGMFSNADGVLDFYADNIKTLTVTNSGITTTVPTTVSNLKVSAAAPTTSVGATGDTSGMMRWDADYIYVCVANYDGVSDIWKRLALGSLTSW